MDEVPTDAWGNSYHYIVSEEFEHGFGLYSLGPDGFSGTQGNDPDDWNSWSDDGRGKKTVGYYFEKLAPFLYFSFAGVILLGVAWVIRGSSGSRELSS
jgi:hypothetical protein